MSTVAPSLSPTRDGTGFRPDGPRRIRYGSRPATPYLFVAPFLVLFCVFVLAPILVLAYSSTRQWILGFDTGGFVGAENYATLLSGEGVLSDEFWNGMKVTAIFTVLSVPLLVVVPFGLALLLNVRFPDGPSSVRSTSRRTCWESPSSACSGTSCSMPAWDR